MIRDLVAGVLCGGVVGAVGLGVLSQVTEGPRAVEEAAVAAPKADVLPVPAPAAAPALVPPAATDAPVVAPQAAAPTPEIASPDVPASAKVGSAPPGDPAPAAVAQAPAVQPSSDAPAKPGAPGAGEGAPSPTTELPAPAAGQPADRLLQPMAEATPAPLPADVKPEPVVPAPAAISEAPAEKGVGQAENPLPKAEGLPSEQKQQALAPEAAVPDPALPTILQPEPGAQLAPAPQLPKAADGVTVGRLPSIAAPAAPESSSVQPATPGAPAEEPALKRYAADFENPSGKPLFSLILLDDGSPELDRTMLAALPFAVTFAVDPLAPNAAQAANTYRAGGKEVVMLASGLPAGATAADVEQSFQAMAAALPETTAVIDLGQDGFQDDRALASQIVSILKADGRALITYDRGLNAADQVARREDLPASVVFRDLDAQGEDTPLIRRYLDRAAFKAAQEGRVTVVGSARPETVAAIMEWTIEGRSSSVTLAPASAVVVAN